MKKQLLSLLLIASSITIFSQIKKPTVIIFPEDNWMVENGFADKIDNQGEVDYDFKYRQAFAENSEIGYAIKKVEQLMADRGFLFKSLEQSLKSIKRRAGKRALMQSKTSSASVKTSAYKEALSQAKADIVVKINYKITNIGAKKQLRYELNAYDAYTNVNIGGASGVGNPEYESDIAVLIDEAAVDKIDAFTAALQNYFEDMLTNGRQIAITIEPFEGCGIDLETEFDGIELKSIIKKWLSQNTVNGRFSTGDQEADILDFPEVRIPLYNESGIAIDAHDFGEKIVNFLRDQFHITSKLTSEGLGDCWILIGEK